MLSYAFFTSFFSSLGIAFVWSLFIIAISLIKYLFCSSLLFLRLSSSSFLVAHCISSQQLFWVLCLLEDTIQVSKLTRWRIVIFSLWHRGTIIFPDLCSPVLLLLHLRKSSPSYLGETVCTLALRDSWLEGFLLFSRRWRDSTSFGILSPKLRLEEACHKTKLNKKGSGHR